MTYMVAIKYGMTWFINNISVQRNQTTLFNGLGHRYLATFSHCY